MVAKFGRGKVGRSALIAATAGAVVAGIVTTAGGSPAIGPPASGRSSGWADPSLPRNRADQYFRQQIRSNGQFARYTTANPQGDTISDPASTGKPLEIQSATRTDDPTTVTMTITTYAPFPSTDIQTFDVPIDTTLSGVADWLVTIVHVPPGVTPPTSSTSTSSSTTSTTVSANGSLAAGISPNTPHITAIGVTMPTTSSVQVTFPRSLIGGSVSFDWAVLALDLSTSATTPTTDLAPDTPTTHPDLLPRVAGADRIATSIQASFFYDQTAGAVVLARDDNYPDALAGAPLAADKNAPLLLTGTASLDPRVLAEIQRALPPGGTVYLLGGLSALSQAVADGLTTAGFQVTRFSGTDRFDTALKVASTGLNDPSTLFFTTGVNFPDALSAGTAAASRHGALLLTNGNTLPAADQAYLQAHPSDTSFAVGGPAAAALPSATGIVGTDRYDTAAKVATTFFTNAFPVGIASGANFPDALSGGATMAEGPGPLLLTDPNTLSTPTANYLKNNQSAIVALYLFGGPAAVTDAVRQSILTALGL
jgi:putative cell wall-binding protein